MTMDKASPSFIRNFAKCDTAKLLQSKRKKITIFGYGSLMNKESLLTTTPSATNFRPAMLSGYRRIFSLVSSREDAALGLQGGESNSKNVNVAVASVTPDPSCAGIMGCLFEICSTELINWQWREFPYDIVQVKAVDTSMGSEANALTVVESNDEVVRMKMEALGSDTEDPYLGQIRIYHGQIWGRPDILPVPRYLEACLQGAEDISGKEGRDNFLDTSYLVDRVTTIREYLENMTSTNSNNDIPN
eukprot:72810_1